MATTSSYLKGLSQLTLISQNTGSLGEVIMLPTATGLVYNPNFEERSIDLQTEAGVAALAQVVETRSAPTYEVELPTTAIAMAIATFGYEWEDVSNKAIQVIRTFRPTTNSIAAVTSGKEGFGIAEDATAVAAYQSSADITKSVQMTQQTWATFDPSVTDDSFAIGANRAIKVSDNIVAAGAVVTVSISQTLSTAREIGETAFDTFELRANIITVGGQKIYLRESSVKVLPSTRNFDSTAESITITFNVLQDGSNCTPLPEVVDKGNAQLFAC